MLPLVSYCERVATGFWAEPLNTVTNVAFVIVALQVWLQKSSNSTQTRGIRSAVIAILLVLVGIGSSLYHSAPGQLTLMLDIIPILSLFAVLTYSMAVSRGNLPHPQSLWITLIVIGASAVAGNIPWFNGSLFYFPAWIMVVSMGILCWRTSERWTAVALTGSFSAAIALRTFDLTWCQHMPIGSHFLWHLFAALSAYFAVRLIR